MRKRFVVAFLTPLIVVLMALGGAYGWSLARTAEQQLSNQQLGDAHYFLSVARQALADQNPAALEADMRRYGDLYDAEITVFDQAGEAWATTTERRAEISAELQAAVGLALSGRRGEVAVGPLPWSRQPATIVEPIVNDGFVVGAISIGASVDQTNRGIWGQWLLLGAISLVTVGLATLVIFQLSRWVLAPLRRVDEAMQAFARGETEARIADTTGPPELQSQIKLFNTMAAEIDQVVTRQQEFVLNASHELRNPLGALLMRVEVLATGLGGEWASDIENTREDGKRMTQILDTLLRLARTAQSEPTCLLVDLGELAHSRAHAWRAVASQRLIKVSAFAEPGLMLIADRTVIESALDAVLDNAVKFSPRGGRIDVRAERTDDGARISVRDSGPGLEPADLERAKTRFWRNTRDQNIAGSGLGLSIANQLLESASGTLCLSSPEGGGLHVELRFTSEGDGE
ncbi:HAMP domain-containing histidine kinase [Leucobacter sp. cx-42]|uniref:sensor histidine kinase n=1 Tax=unclassified Leucobacter TaxID=2621730 RepID=UPI00165E656C|nr:MULTISPECIES: HAMP domain-containing sensor histidine kinase [unclassified Leucobacter]MBC9953460.1 HAMP domain-containing histidine kinase [Leucobacter sp. cx-42]